MKGTRYWIMATMALLLSSCLVISLHPFYTESEIYFDKTILGNWIDQDSGQWTIDRFKFPKGAFKGDSLDNSYIVSLSGQSNKNSTFNAHLFKLDGNFYMDFVPVRNDNTGDDLISLHLIASHSLAKVGLINDTTIKINWYNEYWLENQIKQNHVKIAHEVIKATPGGYPSDVYVLTASTEDLQKFIRKYGKDPEAFKSNWGGMQNDKDKELFSFILKKIKE